MSAFAYDLRTGNDRLPAVLREEAERVEVQRRRASAVLRRRGAVDLLAMLDLPLDDEQGGAA